MKWVLQDTMSCRFGIFCLYFCYTLQRVNPCLHCQEADSVLQDRNLLLQQSVAFGQGVQPTWNGQLFSSKGEAQRNQWPSSQSVGGETLPPQETAQLLQIILGGGTIKLWKVKKMSPQRCIVTETEVGVKIAKGQIRIDSEVPILLIRLTCKYCPLSATSENVWHTHIILAKLSLFKNEWANQRWPQTSQAPVLDWASSDTRSVSRSTSRLVICSFLEPHPESGHTASILLGFSHSWFCLLSFIRPITAPRQQFSTASAR